MATTRPETMLGDTAVAVNPDDERYKDMVGKTVILPIVHREIPIIADEYVEMEFGTGVVKITPAHDPNDFEVGLRHKLPVINVMTEDAKIVDDYPKYAGMDRYEAWSDIHGGSCISYSSYSLLDCLNGILLNREAELLLIYRPVGNHNRLLLVLKVAENLLCYERHIWVEKL